jgi:hypothetical protein
VCTLTWPFSTTLSLPDCVEAHEGLAIRFGRVRLLRHRAPNRSRCHQCGHRPKYDSSTSEVSCGEAEGSSFGPMRTPPTLLASGGPNLSSAPRTRRCCDLATMCLHLPKPRDLIVVRLSRCGLGVS